ncbi:hypothetical protein AB1N83_008141 [Pleurotus pulmonarius]
MPSRVAIWSCPFLLGPQHFSLPWAIADLEDLISLKLSGGSSQSPHLSLELHRTSRTLAHNHPSIVMHSQYWSGDSHLIDPFSHEQILYNSPMTPQLKLVDHQVRCH